jgi:hypothetical protein
MEAGKNSVIYMGLVPGPNKADNVCGKMKVTGMMQQGSTVLTSFVISFYIKIVESVIQANGGRRCMTDKKHVTQNMFCLVHLQNFTMYFIFFMQLTFILGNSL